MAFCRCLEQGLCSCAPFYLTRGSSSCGQGKGNVHCSTECGCVLTSCVGGNGYLRGSRVWDSLYYNNTMRNIRHISAPLLSFHDPHSTTNLRSNSSDAVVSYGKCGYSEQHDVSRRTPCSLENLYPYTDATLGQKRYECMSRTALLCYAYQLTNCAIAARRL